MEVFKVWAEWANQRGEQFVRSARMFPTHEEAMEWYTALKNSFVAAQEGGMVKYFSMHMVEQHLEPSSKEVAYG